MWPWSRSVEMYRNGGAARRGDSKPKTKAILLPQNVPRRLDQNNEVMKVILPPRRRFPATASLHPDSVCHVAKKPDVRNASGRDETGQAEDTTSSDMLLFAKELRTVEHDIVTEGCKMEIEDSNIMGQG